MRITNRLLADHLVYNLQKTSQRMDELQVQLASGKRITNPSDDPSGTKNAMELRSALNAVGQYQRNVADAQSWLQTTDQALQSFNDLLNRARELAVAGANNTLPLDAREAIAQEVESVRQFAIQTANTSQGNRHVFGGLRTTTPPFTETAGVVNYNGDGGHMNREVDPSTSMSVNITGTELNNGAPDLFQTLTNLANDIRNANVNSISGTRIGELEQVSTNIQTLRTVVGAKANRLSETEQTLEGTSVNFSDLLSKAEDLDMARAITDLRTAQASYQMALQVGAKIIPQTLVDFLR